MITDTLWLSTNNCFTSVKTSTLSYTFQTSDHGTQNFDLLLQKIAIPFN